MSKQVNINTSHLAINRAGGLPGPAYIDGLAIDEKLAKNNLMHTQCIEYT